MKKQQILDIINANKDIFNNETTLSGSKFHKMFGIPKTNSRSYKNLQKEYFDRLSVQVKVNEILSDQGFYLRQENYGKQYKVLSKMNDLSGIVSEYETTSRSKARREVKLALGVKGRFPEYKMDFS